jgi:hypothetical protein
MKKLKGLFWVFFLQFAVAHSVAMGCSSEFLEADSASPENQKTNTVNEREEVKLIGGRYIFMQSGYPVEKRTMQYQNFNGLLNDVQYGFTDKLSVAAGVVLPFYAYLAPQFTVEVAPKQRLVIGDILATSFFLSDENSLSTNMVFGGYTYGGIHDHLTAAMGIWSANFLPSTSLVFQFGGCKRLSPSIYLLGELWYSPGYQTMKNVSQWKLDDQGNPQLQDPNNPLGSPYLLNYRDIVIGRNSLYANIQFRLISNKNPNKSWSLGVMYFANGGGKYTEQGPYGEVRRLGNQFNLPLPSISFIQRIGDFRREVELKNVNRILPKSLGS